MQNGLKLTGMLIGDESCNPLSIASSACRTALQPLMLSPPIEFFSVADFVSATDFVSAMDFVSSMDFVSARGHPSGKGNQCALMY